MDLNDHRSWLPRAAVGAALLSVAQQQDLFAPSACLMTLAYFLWTSSPWRLADGAIGGPAWFVRA